MAGAELHADHSFQTRPDPRKPTRPVNLCGFLDPKWTRLMKSWNCHKRWCPPVAETCCETAQRGPTLTTIQRAIKTIVPLWRELHTDADDDSVLSFSFFHQQSHYPRTCTSAVCSFMDSYILALLSRTPWFVLRHQFHRDLKTELFQSA